MARRLRRPPLNDRFPFEPPIRAAPDFNMAIELLRRSSSQRTVRSKNVCEMYRQFHFRASVLVSSIMALFLPDNCHQPSNLGMCRLDTFDPSRVTLNSKPRRVNCLVTLHRLTIDAGRHHSTMSSTMREKNTRTMLVAHRLEKDAGVDGGGAGDVGDFSLSQSELFENNMCQRYGLCPRKVQAMVSVELRSLSLTPPSEPFLTTGFSRRPQRATQSCQTNWWQLAYSRTRQPTKPACQPASKQASGLGVSQSLAARPTTSATPEV